MGSSITIDTILVEGTESLQPEVVKACALHYALDDFDNTLQSIDISDYSGRLNQALAAEKALIKATKYILYKRWRNTLYSSLYY